MFISKSIAAKMPFNFPAIVLSCFNHVIFLRFVIILIHFLIMIAINFGHFCVKVNTLRSNVCAFVPFGRLLGEKLTANL